MKFIHRLPALTLLIIPAIILLSCCRQHSSQRSSGAAGRINTSVISILSPATGTVIKSGDSVLIQFEPRQPDIRVDSVTLLTDKNPVVTHTGSAGSIYWHAGNIRVGQRTIKLTVHYNDSLRESHNINLVILSDISPKNYSYRVIAKYPHDENAYTQGLLFDNGLLYESTGLEGRSSLRVVDISSGKPEKIVTLGSGYFGEGIALFKDQIYQITYKTQVGFVYDKETLQQIRSFDYQIREGWGLTTDGINLIMSDGSAQLFFIEPEYYTQTDRLEVFDNMGMVTSLNELEYINGKILANVYGESYIVVIDPETGKVTGRLDLTDLMPEGSEGDMGKVLNGIAGNPQTGHIYVTGKDWPVLYEIELSPAL